MNLVEEYISIYNDQDIEYKYIYRLIKSNYKGVPAYGIEVERKDYVDLKNVNLERDRVEMISIHRHKVKKIIMKLVENQVSPVHLVDIIGSYVDENAYEFDIGTNEKAIN